MHPQTSSCLIGNNTQSIFWTDKSHEILSQSANHPHMTWNWWVIIWPDRPWDLTQNNRYDLFIPTDAFINQVRTDTLNHHSEVRSSILNHDQILHGLPWTITLRLSIYGLRHIVLATHFVMTLSQSRSYQHQGWYLEASHQYSYSSNVTIHTSVRPSNHRHETWSDH